MRQHTATVHVLIRLIVLGALIALAGEAATFFFDVRTSWTLWWIENGFHILGGAYAFFLTRELFLVTRPMHRTATVWWMELIIWTCGALVIGVMWEWFELAIDRYEVIIRGVASVMTYADNIGDLVFDAFGGLIGVLLYTHYGRYSKQ